MSIPHDDDNSDDASTDAGTQISIDDFVKQADWPEARNWGTITIDASCRAAAISHPTDLKTQILTNTIPETTEAKQMLHFSISPNRRSRAGKDQNAIPRQLDYLQRNLDAMDALINSGAWHSALQVHRWRRQLIISELHRQQTILLYTKISSIPDRVVNLVQRHIRPIVRSKTRAVVEIGALAQRASTCDRSMSLCEMALPSCTESAGIRTMSLKT